MHCSIVTPLRSWVRIGAWHLGQVISATPVKLPTGWRRPERLLGCGWVSEPDRPAGAGQEAPSLPPAYVSGLLAGLSLLAGLATRCSGSSRRRSRSSPSAPWSSTGSGSSARARRPSRRPASRSPGSAKLARFVVDFVVWAAPQVPFVAPFLVFVAVTWPLPRESASLRFQEQASQIILVLLVGYVIEAGAIRWRDRPVNWILSLMTVGILLAGEVYALVDLATDSPDHADIIAGSMAAGVAAILIAAIQGSTQRGDGARPDPGPD